MIRHQVSVKIKKTSAAEKIFTHVYLRKYHDMQINLTL